MEDTVQKVAMATTGRYPTINGQCVAEGATLNLDLTQHDYIQLPDGRYEYQVITGPESCRLPAEDELCIVEGTAPEPRSSQGQGHTSVKVTPNFRSVSAGPAVEQWDSACEI